MNAFLLYRPLAKFLILNELLKKVEKGLKSTEISMFNVKF